ncbi:MAG: pentapeptide repeat-containing protein [Candidatus Acidiferrales bacterium]
MADSAEDIAATDLRESGASVVESEKDVPGLPADVESSATGDDPPPTEGAVKPSDNAEDTPLAPQFPAIASDWAFEEKLAIHKEWVESQGRAGQKIDLTRAKLEGAELVGVNLRFADLQDADLKAADLLLADLRDTCLARTNLEETCLVGANLEAANMEGALLASAMGLVPRQLAGANLRDATLPPQILEFPGLADFERTSQSAVWFFGATISLSLLSWLMMWKTKDVQLISDSSILPFLHSPAAATALPTAEIYLIAPALLLAVYLTFQYHLQRLWDSVLELPAIFPDGRSLDEHRPWIVTGLLRVHFRWMNQDAPSTRFIEKAISVLLAYWLVPVTLLCYWGRYLTQQDMHGTLLHVLLFAAATGVAIYSTTRVGRPHEVWASERKFSAGIFKKLKALSFSQLISALVAILVFLSLGTVKGVPHDFVRAPQFSAADIRRWAPSVFWAIGYDPYADLTEAAISTKPTGWTGADDQLGSVKGAHLNNTKFRYAQAYGVFLANAHLFRSDFTGAFLSEADLRGADLGQSTLRLAILDRAQMAHTNLDRADLDGANMTRADLRGANLSYSSLANATLVDARLDGASLYSARLSGANLIRANLGKADFREAHMEGANLEHAELQQAYLWSAKLSSAHLDNAQLGTAIFIDADLRSSDLHGAHFQGTVLNGANLQGANLDFADMRGALGLSSFQVCSAGSRNGLQLDDAMQALVDVQCSGGVHPPPPTPAVVVGPPAPTGSQPK